VKLCCQANAELSLAAAARTTIQSVVLGRTSAPFASMQQRGRAWSGRFAALSLIIP
jgi:hypothetical protein